MGGKIIKGYKTFFKKETRLVGEFFFYAATRHGDKICQIDSSTGKTESFSSVKDRSTLAAIHMSKLGINKEDVILFCSRNNLSSLYALLVVGTPISSKQLLKTRECFKNTFVSNGYGCTEASSLVITFDLTRDKHLLNKTESCGRCARDVEIKVVDVDTRKHLDRNQKGEICIKTPYIMKGYYQMDSSQCFDEEGFLKTGDIGYYDEDYCFYIKDRIKEMFKYRSWHVVPSHVESILQEHPAVKEAIVFGIPHEIDEFHPAACVILKEGMEVSAEEIERFLVGKLSEWQKLRGGLKIVKSIPKTPSGKSCRKTIREFFLKSLNVK